MPASLVQSSKRIVGSRSGPHVLITGGVHGDEFEPMAAIRQLIDLLNPTEIAGSVTLVPVVNEAAFLQGHRTAEDGLDLARTCPGRADGSITERIAHALSEFIRSADFYIDLHTGGTGLDVLPLAGYGMHPDEAILAQQRQMARAFNLPIVWGTHGGLDGRTLSVARDARVPAIYAEYRGAATCRSEGVAAYVSGCLYVLASLGMIDRPEPTSAIEYIVEDPRPSSGHMQICNPAPMTGFFEPAVQLGGRIEIGQPIGHVSEVLGETVHTVVSQQAGIVLVLRTFPRVLEGESLAVILEVDEFGIDAHA